MPLILLSQADERDIDLGVSDYQCPEGLYVAPHETQCELYYICAAGGTPTHLYHCRDDLLFDLKYYGNNIANIAYMLHFDIDFAVL